MKLIKLSTDHYIMVNDSEIKEGDFSFYPPFGIGKNIVIDGELCFYIESKNGKGSLTQRTYQTLDKNKKITHSTKPLEQINFVDEAEGIITLKIKPLSLSEVKELTGEVDVEKKAEEFSNELKNDDDAVDFGYINGYNQCLEDNKDRKYTEEDIRKAWNAAYIDAMSIDGETYKPLFFEDFIQSLQPKTEWEVEIVDGKLKLKQ